MTSKSEVKPLIIDDMIFEVSDGVYGVAMLTIDAGMITRMFSLDDVKRIQAWLNLVTAAHTMRKKVRR